ncbi:MAG TPA: class I SAM-dependent methyltransferase [Bacteroidia bacterium]
METIGPQEHWDKIYQTKTQQEFSWYQSVPKQSIEFFETFNLPKEAHIIDVGAGDSYFVDYLLEKGYRNIYVLDISAAAIDRAKKRLGNNAEKVNWIVANIIDFKPEVKFDFWHDRAAFHFLTRQEEIKLYLENANESIVNNRYLVVGTFSDSGPLKCSGLETKQYSKQALENEFAAYFSKIKCVDDTHLTPFNTQQNFTYCSFQKVN